MFRSLGLQTDAALAALWGSVEDHGAYVKLSTPRVPTHEITNGLIFRAAPDAAAIASAGKLADAAFAGSGIGRVRLAWDTVEANELPTPGTPLAGSPFRVLVLARQRAGAVVPGWGLRALQDDDDWLGAQAVTRCLISPTVAEAKVERLQSHHRRMFGAYRELCSQGQAQFFGAWRDGVLVAVGGVYLAGTAARMQWLITLPEARRQGACQALLAEAGRWALTEGRAERLILEVLEDNPAGRGAYQAAGFEPIERQRWLWHTLSDPPTPPAGP